MKIKMELRKIDKWDAMVFFSEEDDLYTIAYAGGGGAIICDASLIEAEKKFIEGMHLSEAVAKLLHFKEHGAFSIKT